MEILNLTCKRTNSYLLKSNCGWIIIDTDFPDTLHRLMYLLNQYNIKISDIKYLIVTHFHPDHAGIVQDLKNLGIKLILHECQVSFVDKLNNFFKKNSKFRYTDIVSGDNIVVSSKDSREFLGSVGIEGEIIQTPGHTDDSVSIVIDRYCAFTGDLPGFGLMEAYDDQIIKDSWKLIKEYKIIKIYPAHGNLYTII
ncbi:MAG TPA: MBL fold metallo-hydrolase [Clostridium sp.]|uniref:MBL fold metallo-hydrolase n=1 Tax=Clostridium sp. TaxID=1506 RepID=UPI002F920293